MAGDTAIKTAGSPNEVLDENIGIVLLVLARLRRRAGPGTSLENQHY
jgi:hypothetical protein